MLRGREYFSRKKKRRPGEGERSVRERESKKPLLGCQNKSPGQ